MDLAQRKDILIEKEQASEYAKALRPANMINPMAQANLEASVDENPRLRVRRSLIETDTSDPNGFERLIGESDFVSINFLARGLEAAKSVCRIRVPDVGGGWYGTGFLVGPGLLMTNNHVLPQKNYAAQAEAEFGYEHDVEGVLKDPIPYNLDPSAVFFTDPDHDITLVAVSTLFGRRVFRWTDLDICLSCPFPVRGWPASGSPSLSIQAVNPSS